LVEESGTALSLQTVSTHRCQLAARELTALKTAGGLR